MRGFLKCFIESPLSEPGMGYSIGFINPEDIDGMHKELKEFLGYGAVVRMSRTGEFNKNIEIVTTAPIAEFLIVKSNYFLLKKEPKATTYDKRVRVPKLTLKEEHIVRIFLGLGPYRAGDSLAFIKRKLKPAQVRAVREKLARVVGKHGILYVTDCRNRFSDAPRRCKSFEVFKR